MATRHAAGAPDPAAGLTSGLLCRCRGKAKSVCIDCFWLLEQPAASKQ